jgi:hypothetical protein
MRPQQPPGLVKLAIDPKALDEDAPPGPFGVGGSQRSADLTAPKDGAKFVRHAHAQQTDPRF